MLKPIASCFLVALAAFAGDYAPSTYVTKAEVDAALREMPSDSFTYDRVLKTVDEGDFKVSVVILRRIPRAGVEDTALSHERVTEVYYILSGSGTFESGGAMTNGSPYDLTAQAAGPSTRGTIAGGEKRPIGPGDSVVIFPKVPHRFSHLDGTITYMVTRIEAKPK
jgi:mannose-6-phosphate isomerase-like protein (cupin superfamily)